jgi:hypothetical protein
MKKNATVRLVAALVAAVSMLFAAMAMADTIKVETDDASPVCKEKVAELKTCNEKLASCSKSAADLAKEIEINCPGKTWDGSKVVTKPTGSSTSAFTSAAPAKPAPPPKKWIGKGYSHTPDEAATAEGITCTDPAYAPVIGAKDHTVWCVLASQLPKFQQAIDLLSELESDPSLTDPKNAVKRAEKVKELKTLLIFLRTLQTEFPALKQVVDGLVTRLNDLEERQNAMLRSICDIPDPQDHVKWTPAAIEEQCRKALDKKIGDKVDAKLNGRLPHFEIQPGLVVGGGVAGFQAGARLGVLYVFGGGRVKAISGVNFDVYPGGSLAPRTGALGAVTPRLGFRFYTDEPAESRWSFDVTLGAKQLFSWLGNDPTIGGVKYNAGVLWGTVGQLGLDANVKLSDSVSLVFGGALGYGWRVNTVPMKPAANHLLEEQQGIMVEGHLSLSWSF